MKMASRAHRGLFLVLLAHYLSHLSRNLLAACLRRCLTRTTLLLRPRKLSHSSPGAPLGSPSQASRQQASLKRSTALASSSLFPVCLITSPARRPVYPLALLHIPHLALRRSRHYPLLTNLSLRHPRSRFRRRLVVPPTVRWSFHLVAARAYLLTRRAGRKRFRPVRRSLPNSCALG